MQRHLVDREAKAWVPFESTGELERERLDFSVTEAWVENERLYVGRKAKGAVHVRFDVVVELVPLTRCGEVDETHSRRNTERGRVVAGIGIAECAARRDFRAQPQVGGTEARSRPGRAATIVQRTHLRALVGRSRVIGATKE